MLATREGKALAVVWLLGGTAVSAIALKRHLERGRQRAARRGRRKAAAAAAAANAGGEGEGEATEEEQEGGAKARKVRAGRKGRLFYCHAGGGTTCQGGS